MRHKPITLTNSIRLVLRMYGFKKFLLVDLSIETRACRPCAGVNVEDRDQKCHHLWEGSQLETALEIKTVFITRKIEKRIDVIVKGQNEKKLAAYQQIIDE